MYNKCCVVNCTSKRKKISIHRFPKNEIGLRKWLECINCERLRSLSSTDVRKSFVCHKHFEKRFFSSGCYRSRLRNEAYPTLFTATEISSGIPENVIVKPFIQVSREHDYTIKREHTDHTYVKTNEVEKLLETESEKIDQVSHHDERLNVSSPSHSEPTENPEANEITVQRIILYASSQNLNKPTVIPEENEIIVPMATSHQVESSNVSSPSHSESTEIPENNDNANIVSKSKTSSFIKKKRQVTCTARCAMLRREYRRYQKQSRYYREAKKTAFSRSFEKLTKKMNPLAKKFIYMQIKQTKNKARGRRFSDEEKFIALTILKLSRDCYKFLQSIFTLPSIYTLNKMIANLKVEAGINSQT